MGNCHCRPKEGGENVREFLARKFRSISGKRKVDDLVTIAIHEENIKGTSGGVHNELHLDLTDLEDYEYDSDDDEDTTDSDSSSVEEKIFAKMVKQKESQNHIKDDTNKKYEKTTNDPPPKEEVVQYKEDNDYIRVLQQQLKQVQSELAKLHRTPIVKSENLFDTSDQGEGQGKQSTDIIENLIEPRDGIGSPNGSASSNSNSFSALHGQGDTRRRPSKHDKDEHNDKSTRCDANKMFGTPTVTARNETKDDGHVTDDKTQLIVGRRIKVSGLITEGLRANTASKQPTTKAQMKASAPKNRDTIEDIAAKIAKLQKRDPALPRPDKGIVYPKTMANLSDVDKAYYVEQFLRSEIFRQRCLRKYQGSKTWMNGLSPFQLWVLENEGTADIDNVLHPFARRHNNAQAKVKCWRGDTPPPPPKSP